MSLKKLIIILCVIGLHAVQAKEIKIGSRDFPESVLVAEILSTAIEKYTDIQVDRKFNLGGVRINIAAMQSDNLDIYPDYTGSLLHNLVGEYDTRSYLENYLKDTLYNKYNFSMSKPLGFDNSFVLAVRKDFAEKYDLKTISDLNKLKEINTNQNTQNQKSKNLNLIGTKRSAFDNLNVAFKHSFIKRPDGYEQIKKIYGIEFKNLKAMEYNIALQNLVAGRIDVIDSFSTDSRVKNPKISILKDDRNALLEYSAVYVSNNKTLEKYPELENILDILSKSLNNEKMLELNSRIENGETYKNVADDFLNQLEENNYALDFHKLKQGHRFSDKTFTQTSGKIQARIIQDLPILAKAFKEHLLLSLLAALLASLFGIGIGISMTYNEAWAKFISGLISITQTIPSLALLALLIPIVGLGFYPAISALFIYALLPIIQNTYTGIKTIDNKYIELARSLALNERNILLKVKIPMAQSTIIAGIKISLVICIGTATLATFVGGGGLGDIIKAGLDLNSNYLICLGAIPAALLALVSNLALNKIENKFKFKT